MQNNVEELYKTRYGDGTDIEYWMFNGDALFQNLKSWSWKTLRGEESCLRRERRLIIYILRKIEHPECQTRTRNKLVQYVIILSFYVMIVA